MKIEKSMLLRFGFIALLMNIPVFECATTRILLAFQSTVLIQTVLPRRPCDGGPLLWSTMDGTGERDQASVDC